MLGVWTSLLSYPQMHYTCLDCRNQLAKNGMFHGSAMRYGGDPFKKGVWLLIFTQKSYICIGITDISVSDVDCRFSLGRFLTGCVLLGQDNFIVCAWAAGFGSHKGFPKDKIHK